ncbi:hypothetical protein AVEN_82445-1 [Araneus ventricosus]|uniref:Uncharacterized protein n=1 Tax=Araneus ventricosus TaxID=182803 RepID=A0A4Y2HTI9_ARAVE|nr:hypothetical protein AVEN_82445-1 [Araneus ventricosus]
MRESFVGHPVSAAAFENGVSAECVHTKRAEKCCTFLVGERTSGKGYLQGNAFCSQWVLLIPFYYNSASNLLDTIRRKRPLSVCSNTIILYFMQLDLVKRKLTSFSVNLFNIRLTAQG